MSDRTSSTLMAPKMLVMTADSDDGLEVSVHSLPKPLLREFRHVFGDKYLMNDEVDEASLILLAIPTNQRAREDLVGVGDHIEAEKDRLLNVFMNFASDCCEKIKSKGYWADFVDPCSGLPMLTANCNKVCSEVDGMECLLGYRSHNAGFCKILTHPKWGSSVYPATIFAYAPKQEVIDIISNYPALKGA